jgi:putative methionine-R-sulfoxide reductase with GAF domain
MPHGDIYIPDDVQTKSHFYQHILETLEALLENDSWITNTSNTASLLYHAFLSYPTSYGETKEGKPVCNWSGSFERELSPLPFVRRLLRTADERRCPFARLFV